MRFVCQKKTTALTWNLGKSLEPKRPGRSEVCHAAKEERTQPASSQTVLQLNVAQRACLNSLFTELKSIMPTQRVCILKKVHAGDLLPEKRPS